MGLALDDGDLLTLILLRLPAKHLIILKSVCKKWLSVISSDHFCHLHTLHHPKLQQSLIIQMQSLQLFYFNPTTNGEKVMIPYTLNVPHHHKIVQECNGLLLLESHHWEKSYSVYNPTTRQSRKITLTNNDTFPCVAAIALAFDPSKSPYYKVVCVRFGAESIAALYTYQIEVYDSESHTWNLSLAQFIHPKILNDGVHWNSSIFWSSTFWNTSAGYGYFCCFDIAKNEIKTVYFPKLPHADLNSIGLYNNSVYLQESNGRLYCLELLERHQRASVQVSVSELGGDDCFLWLSKHHDVIRMNQRRSELDDVSLVRFMGGSGRDGSTCSLLTYETELRRMMVYNFLDKSYELLVDFIGQPISRFDKVMNGFQFGEIFALV